MLSLLATSLFVSVAAQAQVKIGVTLSTTGPAASFGVPEKNTIALLPKEIGGGSIHYIVLDGRHLAATGGMPVRCCSGRFLRP